MPGYARQTDQSQVRRTKESPKKENNWFEAKSGSGLVYCEDYFVREEEVESDNESLNSLPRVIDSVSTFVHVLRYNGTIVLTEFMV